MTKLLPSHEVDQAEIKEEGKKNKEKTFSQSKYDYKGGFVTKRTNNEGFNQKL